MSAFAQVGTSDVENYGDLLYPIVLRRLLALRGVGAPDVVSLLGGEAPGDAGYASTPLRDRFVPGAGASTLLVGGGDLLRTDGDVVAGHYRKPGRGSRRTLRRTLGLVGAAAYGVRRFLHRSAARADFQARFRARWMDYPAPGPFVLDPAALPRGSRVAYLSVGVPREFEGDERGRVAAVLDRARFLWVRDRASHDRLRRAGVSRDVHVAPDLVVAVGDVIPRDEAAARGRALLAAGGVDASRPVLCFQCQSARDHEAEIAEGLRRHRTAAGREIVLLPLGRCHGDVGELERVAVLGEGALRLLDVRSAHDALAVIAASDLFVGTSLHGAVTAFSYGIPHLLGPIDVAKLDGFLDVVGAPAPQRLASWRDLGARLDWIGTQPRTAFEARATAAKARAHAAVDALLAALPEVR